MKELVEKNVVEQEVKKSRFIATAVPLTDPAAAASLTTAIGDPEARHNCFAYRVGDQYRFSDDGEPGGTAGRPILAAIEKQQVDRCLVVVTRFFGGIKLGTGGLARAYGGVAAECLRTAITRDIRVFVPLSFFVPFDCIGDVYLLMKSYDAEKQDEAFTPDGVQLTAALESSVVDSFKADLVEATRGRAVFPESTKD